MVEFRCVTFQTLTVLYLFENRIGDVGAKAIGDALAQNTVSWTRSEKDEYDRFYVLYPRH